MINPTMNSLKTKRSLSLDVCQPLVGRKEELEKIVDFVGRHLKMGKAACLYISGLPGTGKTASVKRALDTIKTDFDVKVVCLNCMELRSIGELYKTLYTKLSSATSSRLGPKGYLGQLERLICSSPQMIVLCLDEIDQLTSTSQDILYSAFMWPSLPNSRLVLIGVANAFDLTERLMPKLKLKLSIEPTLLNFRPYTKNEIVDILKFRLCKVSSGFDDSAIEFCARKVSAITGDVRKALEICKLSLDNAKRDESDENCPVKPIEIIQTVDQVYGNRLSSCSNAITLQQKLVLAAALKLVAKSKSFTIEELFSTYKLACSSAKVQSLDSSEMSYVCQILESMGFLKKVAKRSQSVKFHLDIDEKSARDKLSDEHLLATFLL